MSQTRKLILLISVLVFIFLIGGCSDTKNPLVTDNLSIDEQGDSSAAKEDSSAAKWVPRRRWFQNRGELQNREELRERFIEALKSWGRDPERWQRCRFGFRERWRWQRRVRKFSEWYQAHKEIPQPDYLSCGAVDNVKLIGSGGQTVYEDAEDGSTDRWFITTDGDGATIVNVYDVFWRSRVIEFYDQSANSSLALGNGQGDTVWQSKWNNTTQFTIHWDMRYRVNYQISILVETEAGFRTLYYTPEDMDRGFLDWGSGYVHHGLGSGTADGTWRSFDRDLQQDLKDSLPGETVLAVHFFNIKGQCDCTPPVE